MDRRITKSKKALRGALISLMEERGFDGFTVNDLCARADLNRGTFYNHFRDKDDLLARLEDEVMADLDRLQGQMQKPHRARAYEVPRAQELRCRSSWTSSATCANRATSCTRCSAPAATCASARVCATPCARTSSSPSCTSATATTRSRSCSTTWRSYASAYLGVIQRWLETGMRESFGGDGAHRHAPVLHQAGRVHQTVRARTGAIGDHERERHSNRTQPAPKDLRGGRHGER